MYQSLCDRNDMSDVLCSFFEIDTSCPGPARAHP